MPSLSYSHVCSAKLLISILCGLIVGMPQAALAAEPATAFDKHKYVIPAGPLERALAAFAAVTGTPLSFEPGLVAGKTSPGLNGNYSVQEGFTLLLENSGLELVPREGGYSLRPQQYKAVQALKPTMLAEIAVNPTYEEANAWASVGGHVAKRSATATKTDMLISETPQSVSVVTREQMEAQGARTVEQALRYTSGVMTEAEGFGTDRQYTNIRGFRGSYYMDGMKSYAAGNLNDWVAEPWALERVEVLKGPTSVIYGKDEPGGIINQISKRPSATTIREVQMLLGNYDRQQVAIDLGGKANEEGSLLYRVVGLARESGTQVPYGQDDRLYLAPSLTVKASRATTFTLMADMTQDRATPKFDATYMPLKDIPFNAYVGEPGVDQYDRDLASVAYFLEHDFGEDLVFRQNLRFSHSRLDYQQVSPLFLFSDTELLRIYTGKESSGNAIALDNMLQKRFTIGESIHTLLLGFDYQNFSYKERHTQRDAPPLDLLNPVYGLPFNSRWVGPGFGNTISQSGIYLQDQMRLDRWIANLRLRHDKADTGIGKHSNTSYGVGVLYAADNGISPYISYSTSFNPVLAVFFIPGKGQWVFTPETGKQLELGIKYQPANTDTLITASLFDLRKQNIQSHDFGRFEESRTRGLELEAKANIDSQWTLIGSYTYLDGEFSELLVNFENQYSGVARNVAALWLDYRFGGEALQGWSLGGGIRHTDRIACAYIANCFVPGNTVADAALRYSERSVSFALNVSNLFNNAPDGNPFYASLRTIQGTLSYAW